MLLLALTTAAAAAAPPLHGLALVHNSPSQVGLVSIDAGSGALKVIGGAHPQLFGESDLVAVAHGALYFLGDTTRGATLVALNLTTGDEICNSLVDMREIGYVGLGQSLDYDHVKDQLVLSGISAHKNASHTVYRAPADGTCGPLDHVGNFGDAAYVPMFHSSALDAKGQRLFVTLSVGQSAGAIGAIDLTPGGKLSVIAEGPSSDNLLVSMHWDPQTKHLLGLAAVGPKLTMHYLDPAASGTWLAPKVIANVPSYWNAIGGNYATASTFDAKSRSLMVFGGHNNQTTAQLAYELATIDVDQPAVLAHPSLGRVGPPFWPAPGCAECLMALTF
jgi:hypothetical protein